MRLGTPELLIILAVVLVIFGGSRVAQLGGAMGQAIRNFKRGFSSDETTPSTDARADNTSLSSSGKVDGNAGQHAPTNVTKNS